jgi:hypothetical protein
MQNPLNHKQQQHHIALFILANAAKNNAKIHSDIAASALIKDPLSVYLTKIPILPTSILPPS